MSQFFVLPGLQMISNIIGIVAALVFVGVTINDRLFPKSTLAPNSERQLLGKKLQLPRSVALGRNATITLFVSPACHFCSASMVFYRQLSALASASRPSCDVKLRALGPRGLVTEVAMNDYLAANSVSSDSTSVIDFADLSVFSTPTVTVENGSQVVTGVWVGKLTKDGEAEVLSSVRSSCHT